MSDGTMIEVGLMEIEGFIGEQLWRSTIGSQASRR